MLRFGKHRRLLKLEDDPFYAGRVDYLRCNVGIDCAGYDAVIKLLVYAPSRLEADRCCSQRHWLGVDARARAPRELATPRAAIRLRGALASLSMPWAAHRAR